MLRDVPGFKHAVQQCRTQSTEQMAEDQEMVGAVEADQAAGRGCEAEQQCHALATPNIGSVSNDSTKDSTAHEAGDEQDGNVIHFEPIALVQGVQVGTLKPVAHHDCQIDSQVVIPELGVRVSCGGHLV